MALPQNFLNMLILYPIWYHALLVCWSPTESLIWWDQWQTHPIQKKKTTQLKVQEHVYNPSGYDLSISQCRKNLAYYSVFMLVSSSVIFCSDILAWPKWCLPSAKSLPGQPAGLISSQSHDARSPLEPWRAGSSAAAPRFLECLSHNWYRRPPLWSQPELLGAVRMDEDIQIETAGRTHWVAPPPNIGQYWVRWMFDSCRTMLRLRKYKNWKVELPWAITLLV